MKKNRQIIGMLLAIVLFLSSFLGNCRIVFAAPNAMPEGSIYETDSYRVEAVITDCWTGAYNVKIIITNTSDMVIHNWGLLCKTADRISGLYNAKEMEYDGEEHFFKNLGWNQDIPAGESVAFGYTAAYDEEAHAAEDFRLVSIASEVSSERYRVSYLTIQEWDTGAQAEIVIENISGDVIEDWSLEFDTDIVFTEIWNAKMVSHGGNHYVIRNVDDAQNIGAGETLVIGLLVERSGLGSELEHIVMNEITHDGFAVSGNGSGNGSLGDVIGEDANLIEIDGSDMEVFSVKEVEMYWLEVEKNSLNGTLQNVENAVSMNYMITDINDTVLFQGDMEAASEWRISDIGFVIGVNIIRLEAVYHDGSIARKEAAVMNVCEANMSVTGVPLGDTDGDGICDYYETTLGLNPNSADSDGDTIADLDEMLYTGTDPSNLDTDGDGIRDDMEDEDGDGLSVSEELVAGTSPLSSDSDGDGLNDKEEIDVYGTDPCNYDTDGDGLKDGLEPSLGFNPCNPDTDGNGILDSKERALQKISQEITTEGSTVTAVSVDMSCAGDINTQVLIRDTYGTDWLSSDVVGLVGVPVEIHSFTDFDTAVITFAYDETKLGSTLEENLCMMWYDEEDNVYRILEDSVVDTANHTVSYATTHFSTYLLVDRQIWYDTWRADIDYSTYVVGNEENMIHYDIVAAIDYTVSSEELSEEKAVVQNLINGMIEGDRIKIVFYTNDNCFYTTNWYTSTSSATSILNKLEYYYYWAYRHWLVSSGAHDGNVSYALMGMATACRGQSNTNQKMGFIIHAGDVYNVHTSSMQASIIRELDKVGDLGINAISVGLMEDDFLEQQVVSRGGQSFVITTTEALEEALQSFFDMEHNGYEVREFDYLDSDGDGLYDTYEINGMRIQNGTVVYTDPYCYDSDGDGVSDCDEMGGLPDHWKHYMKGNEYSNIINRINSNPNNQNRILDVDYMLVDDMDYLPYTMNQYENIFLLDTGKADSDGEEIYGLYHIFNSNPDQLTQAEIQDILDRSITQCVITCKLTPRAQTFLLDYLHNKQNRFFYDATSIFMVENAVDNLGNNIYPLLDAAINHIQEGETIFITPKPSAKTYGVSVPWYYTDWFAAVHEADCNTVAEISYDGSTYSMNLKYYVFDYYDWSEEQNGGIGIISDQEMYYLCRTGAARFYENWGIYETSVTWSDETDINDIIYDMKINLQTYAPKKNQEELLIVIGGIPHWN